jgi:predicted small lipoprotein YifL
MNKHLLLEFVIVAALATLTACGGAGPIGATTPQAQSAPIEMEVATPRSTQAPAAYDELLSSEFGCSGGGHLEYGLVNKPAQN